MTDVVTNYLAVDFRRIFRLTRTCFAALCEILSTRPEMQVRPGIMGGRERVSLNCTEILWSSRKYKNNI